MLWSPDCPRSCKNCSPYSNIVSDDHATFVCCGDSDPSSRSVSSDNFRMCFRSDTTDSMFDYDETDIKDQIAVMADAIALAHRIGGDSYAEEKRNRPSENSDRP